MTITKRLLWTGTIAIVIVFISVTILGFLLARYQRQRAAACLLVMQQIKVGIDTERDVRNVLAQFSQYENKGAAGSSEERDYASDAYWFDGRSFHAPWSFDFRRFACTVMFHNGIVVEKSVSFMQRNDFTNRTIWVGSRQTARGFRQDFALDRSANGVIVTRASKVLIDSDTRAPASIRKEAFDYNLSCVTALIACSNAEAVLPNIKTIESQQ